MQSETNKNIQVPSLKPRFEKLPSFRILLTALQVKYGTATSAAGLVSGRLFYFRFLLEAPVVVSRGGPLCVQVQKPSTGVDVQLIDVLYV